MTTLVSGLAQIPFAVSLLSILYGLTHLTNTFSKRLSGKWLKRFGMAPRDIWYWRVEKIIACALVTHGRKAFWRAVVMVAVVVGVTEWYWGSLTAVAVFWTAHIVTLLIISVLVLLPLHRMKFSFSRSLLIARDVGPSAGYFGCLGFLTASLPSPWRWMVLVIGAVVLGAVCFMPASEVGESDIKLQSDSAHLAAFVIGAVLFIARQSWMQY